MSKQGFQFKQFYIEHSECAMKVGTDSIMLGSWVEPNQAQKVLDIGTGSGLLAIMLAQKVSKASQILGIDIDPKAISQAKINAQSSPWSDQLLFEYCALQDLPGEHRYDLIISNPPYFAVNTSANERDGQRTRVNARQTVQLNHKTLLKHVLENLAPNGEFHCILPCDVAIVFIESAETIGLFCINELQVMAKPQQQTIRLILTFSRVKTQKKCKKITIYNILGKYSEDYVALCKDYYLSF